MRNLGYNLTEQDLQKVLKEIDKDNSGSIEFNEFVELMERTITDQGTQDELLRAFKLFDKDGSGKISISELGQVMENLGQHFTLYFLAHRPWLHAFLGEKLSPNDLQDMIEEADLDGDGEINFQGSFSSMYFFYMVRDWLSLW